MKYYSFEDIDHTGANYRIVISERSIGKTTTALVDALNAFFERGEQFVYMRRRAEAIKPSMVSQLFGSTYLSGIVAKLAAEHLDIASAVVVPRMGLFYINGYDADGNPTRHETPIGYYLAMVRAGYARGVGFPDTVTRLIWDEFLSSELSESELPDELTLLTNIVSTIKRDRSNFTVYMLGNTVTRHSQILSAMKINVRTLRQGTIKCYEYHDENKDGRELTNTVAVEYVEPYDHPAESEEYFVFGTQREMMIRRGEWETNDFPRFTGDEINNANVVIAAVLDTSSYRLFAYVSDSLKVYVTYHRLAGNKLNYITLTEGATSVNRKTFNINSTIPMARRLMVMLTNASINGYVLFENNLAGDDFEHFLTLWKGGLRA